MHGNFKINNMKNTVYIEYLNKDNNFKKERKEFKSYEAAMKWMKENFEVINPDFINYI